MWAPLADANTNYRFFNQNSLDKWAVNTFSNRNFRLANIHFKIVVDNVSQANVFARFKDLKDVYWHYNAITNYLDKDVHSTISEQHFDHHYLITVI